MTPLEAFERFKPLAERIARNYRGKLPSFFLEDDVMAAALAGLWGAALRHSKLQPLEFERLAFMRVRGAILDECRVHDWLPRHSRGSFAESYRQIYVDGFESLDRFDEFSSTPDLDAQIDSMRHSKMLAQSIARMPDKRAHYIVTAVMAGREQALVAIEVGLTQARVSQIIAESITWLRDEMRVG